MWLISGPTSIGFVPRWVAEGSKVARNGFLTSVACRSLASCASTPQPRPVLGFEVRPVLAGLPQLRLVARFQLRPAGLQLAIAFLCAAALAAAAPRKPAISCPCRQTRKPLAAPKAMKARTAAQRSQAPCGTGRGSPGRRLGKGSGLRASAAAAAASLPAAGRTTSSIQSW